MQPHEENMYENKTPILAPAAHLTYIKPEAGEAQVTGGDKARKVNP